MENTNFVYDAFISYRHTELDKYIAETLHKQLEAFKPPRKIANNINTPRKKISRVFRDKDELPLASNLEDTIIDALQKSDFLIVICSPRLKESMWCKKEIETFIKMHGRRKVLAVLIEGEPSEAFPDELLYDEETILHADGSREVIRKPIEPLAADFRGSNKKEMKKAMKSEILRLLAPMFGVNYDDLKQRHREQRLRKVTLFAALVAALGIAFGTYSTLTAIKINEQKNEIENQKDEIEEQKNQIEHQAELLANEQVHFLSNEALLYADNDDRVNAVKMAYYAMTEYQGIKMPETAEAERTLVECLRAYDGGSTVYATSSITTKSAAVSMKVSPDGSHVLTYDRLRNVTLWDIVNKEIIFEASNTSGVQLYGFIDDDNFYYVTVDEEIIKYNISSGKPVTFEEIENPAFHMVTDIRLTDDAKYLVASDAGTVKVIDAINMSPISTYESDEGVILDNLFLDDSKTAFSVKDNYNDGASISAIDIESGNLKYKILLDNGEIRDGLCCKGVLYVLSTHALDLFGGYSIVTAIDIATGDIIYQNTYDNIIALNMLYSEGSGGEHILIYSASQSMMIDVNDGTMLGNYKFAGNVAMVTTSTDGGFYAYCGDGTSHIIRGEYPHSNMTSKYIVSHNVSNFASSNAGLLGIIENDNRMVIYTYVKNMDSFVYDGELGEPIEYGEYEEEATKWAIDKNIDKATSTESYVVLKDANLIAVSYVDDTISLYRADTMELLNTYDDCANSHLLYYGKINDYYVIASAYTAYLFDEDGNLRGKVPNFAGVTDDNKYVVVYGKDDDFNSASIAIPVYTKDMLLEKTKNYLEKVDDE